MHSKHRGKFSCLPKTCIVRYELSAVYRDKINTSCTFSKSLNVWFVSHQIFFVRDYFDQLNAEIKYKYTRIRPTTLICATFL